MDVERIGELWSGLREGVGQVIVGQEETMRLMMVALLTGGHVLLEGLPGTGKTLLAQAFASALRLDFKRIQFTPDLMPGDVVGTNLFNFQTNEFRLTRGPLFTEFLLADEINRTPPKTQSALLEAMQERRVTIDGETYPLSKAFIVVATQNPIEHEGTYPLPEAQLDRFLFHIQVESPDREQEIDMVRRHATRPAYDVAESLREAAVTDRDTILAARDAVSALRIADELVDYVVDLVRATRDQPSLRYGASPRTSNMLAGAARAAAALEGRTFVIPDDVKGVLWPTMRHRVALSPAAEVEGQTLEAVLRGILDQVPAPR